jgi:hypothetical protein
VIALMGPLVAALVVALVVTIDLGGYAFAAARAQAAADAGALAAAVAAHPDSHGRGDPAEAARRVIIAQGGDLVHCFCPSTRGATVQVVARMPVGGLVIRRILASSVDATARATTVRVSRP